MKYALLSLLLPFFSAAQWDCGPRNYTALTASVMPSHDAIVGMEASHNVPVYRNQVSLGLGAAMLRTGAGTITPVFSQLSIYTSKEPGCPFISLQTGYILNETDASRITQYAGVGWNWMNAVVSAGYMRTGERKGFGFKLGILL